MSIRNRLDEIMNLYQVTCKLKISDYQDIGFIAQEVKKIIPEIVYGEVGGKTLSYGLITPVLASDIQEQQEQIDSLISENQTLGTLFNTNIVLSK